MRRRPLRFSARESILTNVFPSPAGICSARGAMDGLIMNYLVTIGLEVHVQLNTRSKMFCGCGTTYGAPPNTLVCPVCLGYPGALPTMNKAAVRLTVLTGLMLGSDIGAHSRFDRKSYFYPDMPKNYQISQYDKPLCVGGSVDIEINGAARTIGVKRVHLEEDVGKSIHLANSSVVDFNRAGVPLMEIVSEPELSSPDEALAYLLALKQILLYAGVSNCNLEEGNVRCDVNCSIRPEGRKELGAKTEIKNLNTFKGVHSALKHEIARQVRVVEGGGGVRQETRRWDSDAGITVEMRSKESEHDYRYFPDPDLMPIVLSKEDVAEWRAGLPELPSHLRKRLVNDYGLPEYDACVLAADKAVADYFEAAARQASNPKAVSNWIMTEMLRLLSESGMNIRDVRVTPGALARLVKLVEAGTVNTTTAKEIFAALFEKGGNPDDLVKEKGLTQVSDSCAIEKLVAQAISENAGSVDDYRKGKKASLKFLIGQIMRLSKGKANPRVVAEVLQRRLDDNG